MNETVNGLKAILEMSDCPVVIWENEFFGPVEMNGKRFVETVGYQQFKSRVLGLVLLEKKNHKTAEADLRSMHARRLTWDEALTDSGFMTMQRNRLTIMRREIADQLEKIELYPLVLQVSREQVVERLRCWLSFRLCSQADSREGGG